MTSVEQDERCAVTVMLMTDTSSRLMGIIPVPVGVDEFDYLSTIAKEVQEMGCVSYINPLKSYEFLITSLSQGTISLSCLTNGKKVDVAEIKNLFKAAKIKLETA